MTLPISVSPRKFVSIKRKFVSIKRTIDPETGAHNLDAIASDGSAWWRVICGPYEEDDTGWQQMEPLPMQEEPTLG